MKNRLEAITERTASTSAPELGFPGSGAEGQGALRVLLGRGNVLGTASSLQHQGMSMDMLTYIAIFIVVYGLSVAVGLS